MKYLRPLMIGTFVVLIILLGLSGWFLYQDSQQAEVETVEVAVSELDSSAAVSINVPVAAESAVEQSAPLLPPPSVQEFPTVTPLPTAVPTDTPIPTATAVPPTETAVPPTNPPPPTAVPVTNTPVPPTETAVPIGPQPQNANGLIAPHFAIQDRTNAVVNGQIWFEFVIQNSSGGNVPYSALGVMPRKNGTDFVQWYKNSWGGNNDQMPPGGLSWEDWMPIPEAGEYTLRMVICFDGFQTCINGGGTFYTISNEVAITVR